MSSPQKRGGDAVNSSLKTTSNRTNEFPPIRSRSPKKGDSRTSNGASSSKRRSEDSTKNGGLPRVGSRVSYAKKGDQLPQVLESGEELEVLKCILVREGYLQRLAQASLQGKVSGSHLSETIDILDLLRVSTIEVVEAIVTWRIKQQKLHRQVVPEPSAMPVFTWNSINYLLKVASDLDFLEKHQGLVQWLGFTLIRNPFILPVNLDTRHQLDRSESGAGNTVSECHHKSDSSSQFVQVGGKRVAVDQGREALSALRAAQAAALADRKRAKNPYETRVLNDDELAPIARIGINTVTTRPGTRTTGNTHIELPSQIGELDMYRIHVCERVVLQEEATYGSYTRDVKGQLVPESEAIRRRNMVDLSGDAYTRVCDESNMTKDDPISDRNMLQSSDLLGGRAGLNSEAHAKKRAGMLGPISKPQQRKPVRKAPGDRSRGAHLEETLQQERKANYDLGLQIDRIREEIERKEMDLAYFESFPGVQLYGNELEDFRRKTRADVALLRRDLEEKDYVYKSRSANLDRKEEIIRVFKEDRKRDVEAERHSHLQTHQASMVLHVSDDTNQEVEEVTSLTNLQKEQSPAAGASNTSLNGTASPPTSSLVFRTTQPIVHDMCATLIQKIARGKLARAAYEVLKIEYYVGSKYIQAVVRGFLARRRVAKLYWQLTASILLQRFARGMLARRFAARRRHTKTVLQATIRIQRTFRGYFGRIRMKRVRRLFVGRKQLLLCIDELNLSDLRELADACLRMATIPSLNGHPKSSTSPVLSSLVLGLVRVVMVFTTDRDEDVCITSVRWKEAAHFLRCSSRLQRRLGKIAGVAAMGDRYLRTSLLGSALLDMYCRDSDFNEKTFANLETGWRAAMVLYRWVTAFHTVCQEQCVLDNKSAPKSTRPFLFSESTTTVEAMQERVEEEENSIVEHTSERRFVPRDLVSSAKARTRAMLLVIAFDVPNASRNMIINHVRNALPGLFIVMNRRQANAMGHESEVTGGRRLSKVHTHQLDILGADYASVRESLAVGHSVILDCDIGLTDAQQRRFVGAFTALKASIKPSPLCIMVRGSLHNRSVLGAEDNSTSPRLMVDDDIKRQFEQRADWLNRLSQPEFAREMVHVSSSEAATSAVTFAFVLVMEAVVILLTPGKRYEAPQRHTSGVSWKLARRLLANPSFFISKLANVKYESISSESLRTLNAYLTHSDWPTLTFAHGASGGLLHGLASWVHSVVTCAQIALNRHGLAPGISHSTPVTGLFDNVIIYSNLNFGDGEMLAFQEVLDAALTDVRVYRRVHTLDARRCVISVYHDCQRLYFCAYDPTTSWRWQRIVLEEEVDALLAPNSIERGEDAAIKRQPPSTREEMYDRLVQLCLLQPIASNTSKKPRASEITAIESGLNPKAKQLIVRPPAIRLFRRVIRLGGHRATITLAELSRGRIQVDVAVHGLSLELRRIVNLEHILERLSHRAALNVFIPPERLPALVLERLYMFRRLQSSASLLPCTNSEESSQETLPSLILGVRTKESAPGRVVLRKAIRSQWLMARKDEVTVWIFTVTEHHHEEQFRVEIYQPQSSERFARAISKREFQDLRLAELCQHPSSTASPQLLRTIIKLFQFVKDPDESHDGDAPIRSCILRHHILARFPLGIRFVVSPHHEVENSGVLRTYVQVETRECECNEGVRIRICLPESCEEQAIEWKDAEVDAFFVVHGVSWRNALQTERKHLAYNLTRNVLRWDPSKQRVTAELPCGSFEAVICTRDTGVRKTPPPPISPKRSRQSVFAARSSRALLPVSTSCIQLLDSEIDDEEMAGRPPRRMLFLYDKDERIHSGSYRANGVLVTVQVFMKAVIVTIPKPRLPVDRLEQEDSFELTFDFYHPATSSSERCVIYGRTYLREVVGPDKAALIASTTIHQLVEHIIEARTSIHFETIATKKQGEGQRIVVSFVRDRLYTKHKVTPLQRTLESDTAANATKLIDAKPDRGLKLLTRTKTLTDTYGGKVILTVFDVRHTRSGQASDVERSTLHLRVDGYITETSTRLSLSLKAPDLAHILDEELTKLINVQNGSSAQETELTSVKLRLAQLVIDHLGVERKRDGTPDRLFLMDTLTTHEQGKEEHKRLVGKTVRQVRHQLVVVTMHTTDSNGFEIDCYDPNSSARATLMIPSALVGLDSDDEHALMFDSLDRITAASLVKHILSFVHIDTSRDDSTQLNTLCLRASEDDVRATPFPEQFTRLREGHTFPEHDPSPSCIVRKVWRGLKTTVSADHDLCLVLLGLQLTLEAHDVGAIEASSARLVCSVISLRKRLATTHVMTSDDLASVLSSGKRSQEDLLQECAAKLHLRVLQSDLQPPADASEAHSIPQSLRIVIEMYGG